MNRITKKFSTLVVALAGMLLLTGNARSAFEFRIIDLNLLSNTAVIGSFSGQSEVNGNYNGGPTTGVPGHSTTNPGKFRFSVPNPYVSQDPIDGRPG